MIKLQNNFCIDADAYGFRLYQETGKESDCFGKKVKVKKSETFHISIENALKTYVDLMLRAKVSTGELTSIAEVLDEIKSLKDSIHQELTYHQ